MINFDSTATRFGAQAAGWIVLLEWSNPEGEKFFEVNNKLFRTEEEAVRHAKTVNKNYKVTVKALRWSDVPADPGRKDEPA